MFLDDNATVDKSRMIKICELIKTRNIKCLFGALCSIKCYDKEMLEKMYEAGFRWIHFGLESGSQRLLKTMNKERLLAEKYGYIRRGIHCLEGYNGKSRHKAESFRHQRFSQQRKLLSLSSGVFSWKNEGSLAD